MSRVLDVHAAVVEIVPDGWNVANLYEAVNPKHRPWWGCVLRHDEPYRIVKVLGARTATDALRAAALKVREEFGDAQDPEDQ